MAAPTNAAGVKKALANPEPSTHGPSRHFACGVTIGRYRGEADIKRQQGPAGPVENDPIRTSTQYVSFQRATQTFRRTSVYDYIQLFGRVVDRRL